MRKMMQRRRFVGPGDVQRVERLPHGLLRYAVHRRFAQAFTDQLQRQALDKFIHQETPERNEKRKTVFRTAITVAFTPWFSPGTMAFAKSCTA
jgi:hypothetical protein